MLLSVKNNINSFINNKPILYKKYNIEIKLFIHCMYKRIFYIRN